MPNNIAASGISSAIRASVGVFGMHSANDNDSTYARIHAQQEVQANKVKATTLVVTKFLSSIDATLRAQLQSNRYAYNQSIRQARENAVEQYQSEEPTADAVPVETEEASSGSGGMLAILAAAAAAFSYAGYKLYESYKNSVTSLQGDVAAATSDVVSAQQAATAPPVSTATPPAPPAAPPELAPPPRNPRSAPKVATPQAPASAPKPPTAAPSGGGGAPAAPATPVSQPPAVPPVATPPARPTTPPPAQPTTPPAQPASPDATNEFNLPTAAGSGNIIALGKALQALGLRVDESVHFGDGSVSSGHSKTGGHYDGTAIDVNAPGGVYEASDPKWGPYFDKIAAAGKSAGYHTLWRTKGHFDHIHFQYSGSMGKNSKIGAPGDEGTLTDQASAAIAATYESTKDTLKKLIGAVKPTNLATPSTGSNTKVIDMVTRIKEAAKQREQDMIESHNRPAIDSAGGVGIHPASPPPPVSRRNKTANVVNEYFVRFIGDPVVPTQMHKA